MKEMLFATHPLVNYMSPSGGVPFVNRLLTMMYGFKVQQMGNLPQTLSVQSRIQVPTEIIYIYVYKSTVKKKYMHFKESLLSEARSRVKVF